MDLRGYEHAKFKLSEILQSADTLARDSNDRSLKDRLSDLRVRLAEDRFTLVVAGRFSRGKSSLMNAILGTDRLPTGIVPLTSVITTVSYGTVEKVTLKYKQRRLDSEITLAELPQFVTQEGNPGNILGIETAHVEIPAELLRRGFYFVDTPGLGSIIAENSLTTQAYLPEADALLLVTSFESPLSEEELRFFSTTLRSSLPIFVTVNKHDLVSGTEREQALAFVRSHLQELYGSAPPKVFSVSARDGLAAKRTKDAGLLRASGLPALEDALTRFLLEQKSSVFLARMSSRVEDLLNDIPASDGLAALRQRAHALSQEYRAPRTAGDLRLGDEFTSTPFSRNQLRSCQICAAVETETWNFLTRYQYQLSIDRRSQGDFAERSGFCCYHTSVYQSLASPFGTCSGFPSLLERLAEALRAAGAPTERDPKSAIDALLPNEDKCILCAIRAQAEALALVQLSDSVRKDGAEDLSELSALCLPHLAAVANVVGDPTIIRALATHHALTYERTAEDMRRFTLKQSAARRQLESKEEETAAQRGLMLLAGRRNVNFAVGHVAASLERDERGAPRAQRRWTRT